MQYNTVINKSLHSIKEIVVPVFDADDIKWDDSVSQGPNPWVSGHVKQTPHDPNMIWASNQYLIVFKVNTYKVT